MTDQARRGPHPTTGPGRPRVLAVQHQADCSPAWLGTWLAAAGCEVVVVHPWRGEPLPPRAAPYDGLLVLGGSMGAHDDAEVAWLAPLKDLVRDAVSAEVPTLGICLGHQLVAAALGGRVAPGPDGQRVGLNPIGWTEQAATDPLVGGLRSSRVGVHWNGDVVVEEPAGTVALARTADGALQVARFAPRAWGVQLHPEADRGVVVCWAAGDAERHAVLGVDQPALLAAIEAAEPELRAAWEPLARSFAALCAVSSRARS